MKVIGALLFVLGIVVVVVGLFFIESTLSGMISGPRTIAIIDGKLQDVGLLRLRHGALVSGPPIAVAGLTLVLFARRRRKLGTA